MPFHPLSHAHISRPATRARLLRLLVFVLGVLLLWASGCSATHAHDSHAQSRPSASADLVPLASSDTERAMPHEPHPHSGAHCAPDVVSQVPPQARQLFTDTAVIAVFAGVAAGVTAAVAGQQWVARHGGSRPRIRRSGRSTLAVVCRWRI
ncbi:hypothetical protein [Streptomyces botrytidirepellens]|uniref:Uncharacterized protein n=1 Tax=Streptomyces botrytidirepellens TaxID=2486417 RepID=A0A3M8SFT1_9ACTN|nr:hypothetical protein [Streptomyces botrytidirepellens]RNF77670.1 hypothetical protein EEJ42_49950 [Streptomyces botrytidirepellens]